MYSATLLDLFAHPRNPGEVADASAVAQVENPVCGDVLRLSARFDQGRIAEIRFRAKGCVPSMACASAITELVQGMTLAQAGLLERQAIVDAVGGLPPASTHASQLAWDALQELLRQAKPQSGPEAGIG